MYKSYRFIYFILLSFLFNSSVHALVQVDGVLYGDVSGLSQNDPLYGILNTEYTYENPSDLQRRRFVYQRGLYQQGLDLKDKCEKEHTVNYSRFWMEGSAKRAVAATLQYLALDMSVKAIVEYAKKLEFSDDKFSNLSYNLVQNTCNQNISVFGLKLLRDSFAKYWKSGSGFSLPTIAGSPYYSSWIKKELNTRKVLERQFNYTLRNFRSFCSWNGDSDDYSMLVPYLNNPFIMSFVFNNLLQRKIDYDLKLAQLHYSKNTNSVQVACEDLICRKRSPRKFKNLFPRMNGSTSYMFDYESLYCDYFSKVQYKKQADPIIKKWINGQTLEESKLEASNLIALITGVPDFTLSADKFQDILALLKSNIRDRWNQWADNKSEKLELDLLYEESLKISLDSKVFNSNVQQGDFSVYFTVSLGEIDTTLNEIDKIKSSFELIFPKKYIGYLRKRSIFLSNKGKHKELAMLKSKFVERIGHQVRSKVKKLKITVWNEDLYGIIANELLAQIHFYRGGKYKTITNDFVKIPVNFRYGIFALQYMFKKAEYSKILKSQKPKP